MTLHLRPTAELAPRALLPGDPGRAMALAQELISKPLMFNHHRGLWGYTGPALHDGLPLTIQSTGMGGPSAAIVLHELIELGLRSAVRVGTCGALAPELALGDTVVAADVLACDGTSRALGGASDLIAADSRLRDALLDALPGAHGGTIASTDLFYADLDSGWRDRGAIAVEMEAAALFALGARRGVAVACGLIVSDVFEPERRRIEDDRLLEASVRLARAAIAALAG